MEKSLKSIVQSHFPEDEEKQLAVASILLIATVQGLTVGETLFHVGRSNPDLLPAFEELAKWNKEKALAAMEVKHYV